MTRVLALIVLFAAQDVPDHPDKLTYKPLEFKVPDSAALRVELATGAVGYLMEDTALPLVELEIYFRAGSFWEPSGKEGVAAFTGQLMRTGGTTTRSPEVLDEELDFLAAELGVRTESLNVAAHLSILSKDLDRGLDILFDILLNPAFQQERLETLRTQTLERLRARNDATEAIEERESNLLFYGDYPLNRLPTQASIEGLRREDLADYHARMLTSSRCFIAAAGAFQKDELIRKLNDRFQKWPNPPKTGLDVTVPEVTHKPKPGIYCFHKEGENITQGRVTIGHMGITLSDPDVHSLRLLSYIYGAGGFSSRLVTKVRTQEGLAYDVNSDFRPGTLHPLPFKIDFQSKNASCAYAAKLCLEELDKIQKEGVTEQELRDAVNFYLDAFPGFFFSTPAKTVQTFAKAELFGYPADYYQTYREKIAACTVAELHRVARERVKPSEFVWIVVGNVDEIKKGDEKKGVKLGDLGTITDVPLADPLTLKRP